MEFLQSMLSSFLTNAGNMIIYTLIVVLFLIGVLFCILPVIVSRGRLRRAVRMLKSGNKKQEKQAPWQENDFLGNGILKAHWIAYLNNLFFAEDGTYHNASNVEDFINEETAIYAPGRAAFADALPTLLVSLGFLGTLIGLAQGLSGFNMTDSAAAQESINTLIPGMRYAFMTSIFGVIGSVLFTLITRAVYGSTEHTLRSFYGAMSRYANVGSVDPLTQVAFYQQQQTEMIRTMSQDLNGRFTENMANAIQDAVEPLNQNMKSFMNVMTKDQMRFLDAVVMRFVDRMNEVLGGQLRDFSRTLDAANRAQREASEAATDNLRLANQSVQDLKTIERIAKDLTAGLSGYLDDLRANAQLVEESYDRMTGAMESIDKVVMQQNSYMKTVAAMQGEVAGSMNAMTQAVSGFAKKLSDENVAASQSLQTAAKELRAAGQDLTRIHNATSQAFEEELHTTLDSYREYVNQFTKRVDYLAASISDALNALPAAVNDTSNQFLDQIDRMTVTLDEANRALNDAVDRLYGK
ncbi:MAG: DUF1049 domain-containing protein [Clostridiales bacterium]|nr:DUF1049 domain-containing protein [Clostridiales bacterium]